MKIRILWCNIVPRSCGQLYQQTCTMPLAPLYMEWICYTDTRSKLTGYYTNVKGSSNIFPITSKKIGIEGLINTKLEMRYSLLWNLMRGTKGQCFLSMPKDPAKLSRSLAMGLLGLRKVLMKKQSILGGRDLTMQGNSLGFGKPQVFLTLKRIS